LLKQIHGVLQHGAKRLVGHIVNLGALDQGFDSKEQLKVVATVTEKCRGKKLSGGAAGLSRVSRIRSIRTGDKKRHGSFPNTAAPMPPYVGEYDLN